jgi:quercetin dioxygenase-like cupin family protein
MAFECTLPAVPTVQQDDDVVRITRWDFPPGAVTGWHTHGWPYFIVMLTDAAMQLHDGTAVTEVSLVAGQSYRRPAGVSHDVKNAGSAPMAFVEIELKNPAALTP